MTEEAFELTGRVEAVLAATTPGSHVSTRVGKIQLIVRHGVKGDLHAGARLADAREKGLAAFGLPKGIEIANHREVSIVSLEELTLVGEAMKLPASIPYGCLGENLVLGGIPRLTELPTGTLLFFRKDERTIRTAVLAVWGENTPCTAPGEAVQACYPAIPGLAGRFPKAARGRRGLVAGVYCSGKIHEGDAVIAKIPRQRIYVP